MIYRWKGLIFLRLRLREMRDVSTPLLAFELDRNVREGNWIYSIACSRSSREMVAKLDA
jgi:hypothetical protein